MEKEKERQRDVEDGPKRSNVWVIRVSEREEREKSAEAILKSAEAILI